MGAVINGRYESWSNIEWTVIRDGAPAQVVGEFQSCDYDDGNDAELVRGAGYDPLGSTDGSYVPGSMSMVWLTGRLRTFAKSATGNGAVPLSSVLMQLSVKRRLRGATEVSVDDVSFRMNDLSDSAASGSGEATKTTIGCLLIGVRRDGVQL